MVSLLKFTQDVLDSKILAVILKCRPPGPIRDDQHKTN